ncbi:MAG TPA: tetratricopeptide repeat protein [Candidatus Acidoferrum sp.]
MRFTKPIPIFVIALLLFACFQARAQNPPGDSASKPVDQQDAPPPKAPVKPNKDNATQNAPDQPTWDPLRAEKDLEVGQYYMHKGDVDAAIDRFQDATLAKPGYAIPFRFLGEAQEKKGLKKQAIKSYQRYVDLYPHAEDGDKIRKKIEKLYKEAAKEKEKR